MLGTNRRKRIWKIFSPQKNRIRATKKARITPRPQKKGLSCSNRTTLRNQHCHPSPPSWSVLNLTIPPRSGVGFLFCTRFSFGAQDKSLFWTWWKGLFMKKVPSAAPSLTSHPDRLIRVKELFNAPSKPVPLPVVSHLLKRQRQTAGLVPHVVPFHGPGLQQPAAHGANGRLCLVGIRKRRPPA